MKRLRVYGGRYYGPRSNFKQGRMLIGAYSKKQAMELGEISYNEISHYFCETGNDFELNLVKEVGVWILDDYKNVLVRLK